MNHHEDDWQVTLSYDTGHITEAQVDQILESLKDADGAGSFSINGPDEAPTDGSASVTVTANNPHAYSALNLARSVVEEALGRAGVEMKTLEYVEVCRYEED